MNVKTLIAAVTLLTTAGAVLADDVAPFIDHSDCISTRTRAEVAAEMAQAAAKGSIARTPEAVDYSDFVSTKTRSEVIAELAQAAAAGSVARTPEYAGHGNVVSTRTREEVRNEAIHALQSSRANASSGG